MTFVSESRFQFQSSCKAPEMPQNAPLNTVMQHRSTRMHTQRYNINLWSRSLGTAELRGDDLQSYAALSYTSTIVVRWLPWSVGVRGQCGTLPLLQRRLRISTRPRLKRENGVKDWRRPSLRRKRRRRRNQLSRIRHRRLTRASSSLQARLAQRASSVQLRCRPARK